MSKKYRIALGSLMTECNHLGGQPTDLHRFQNYELRRGEDASNSSGAAGGMIEVLRARDADIAPLIVATACPGGPLTGECYRALKSEMLERLRACLPVDGVLLALHGSATAEDVPDLEGDLLRAVRELVDARTPIVATLDPHAHVTLAMIENADALLAFETYPHVDTHQTGARAARLLLRILDEDIRPTMAMAKVPVLVSGVNGETDGDGPFAQVMRLAKSFETQSGVLTTSAFLVHPYLDLPEMGGGGLVVTDGDLENAEKLARQIAELYWDKRFELEPETLSPREAIERGMQIEGGPVLLVECADCCGGGAAGDSVATLRALIEANLQEISFAPVVDPQAAARCHEAGEGAILELELGHKLDPQWGEPLRARARVLHLGDGKFFYRGGIWDSVEADMGKSAVVEIGKTQVLVMSDATYDWADEQFVSMQMHPRDAKFIVVKNPMNYRVGYAGMARAAFILDTPGPTPATLRGVEYSRLARPYFPADQDIPDLQFQILKGNH
jgi:microcystin degradation protein MlrC